MPEFSYDLERSAVRVVLADAGQRILLFHARTADSGDWWELPGGGIEPGESYLDAAVRAEPGPAAGRSAGLAP